MQNDTNKPRTIQEMLAQNEVALSGAEATELEQLKHELAQKDKLISQQQEIINRERGDVGEKIEGTPPVSREVLEQMVQSTHRAREIKGEIERDDRYISTDEHKTQQKSKASQAQKAALKQNLVDDIARVSKLERPKQVKALVFMALQRGVQYAYSVAKALNNPHLLDEFHDALAVELRELLCETKKIKNCT